MTTLGELVRAILVSNDADTTDFEIFLKERFTVYDHYRVWLRILQDHMRFIHRRASDAYKQRAQDLFDEVSALKAIVVSGNVGINQQFYQFNDRVIAAIEQARLLKVDILTDLLNESARTIAVLLPPTLISHMLDELKKFRFMVYYIRVHGELPPTLSLNEHKLWISDIAGHLGSIEDNLDSTEKLLRKRLLKQKKIFKGLHEKALEYIHYHKHGVQGGNNNVRLNNESNYETLLYLRLVREILTLREANMALGIIDRHMLLHMIFEEIYYLRSLSVAEIGYDPIPLTQILDPKSQAVIEAMPE